MTRQPGCLPTRTPDNTAIGLVQVSDAYGNLSWQPLTTTTEIAPTGLTGATASSRYVGATASGAPASGTFALGDFVVDQTGAFWICTTAGSPGTWTEVNAGAGGISPPAGDIGGSTGTPTVVATHLSSALPVNQGGTNATSAGAALTSLGAAAASALTTETSRATAAEAALLPLAGGTMSGAIAMGTSKITGLGNGSGAQDAAAFGQIPSGSSPLALGSGGTGQTSAAAAYNALSPMTTTGDLEYESGTNTAGRLAIGSTKQILTVVSGLPAWQSLDATATDIVALGTQAAGATGKAADAGHVHPDLNLYLAPTGATAETFSRRFASASQVVGNTGVLYVCGIAMAAGIVVNNITMLTGTTAKTGGTHGWYILCDSNMVCRAVTADQTDAATVWGTATTAYTLPTNAYTTTYTGLYYIGVMVAQTSGGVPTFLGPVAPLTAVNALAPILSGSSSSSQTTAPSTGTTMTALSNGTRHFYAYTS